MSMTTITVDENLASANRGAILVFRRVTLTVTSVKRCVDYCC